MLLIDTHLHVVSSDRDAYPVRPATAAQLANGSWWDAPDEFGGVDAEAILTAVRRAGIDGAMVVQAYGPYGDDNTYLFDSLGRTNIGEEQHPALLLTSVVDPTIDPTLFFRTAPANHGATRLFHIPTPPDPWLDGPDADRMVEAASLHDLVVVLCVQAHDLGRVERLVRRWPDVPFVLDHCGFANLTSKRFVSDPEVGPLLDLANLTLKVTPTALELCAPAVDARDVLGRLASEFGAQRLVWGSDYPQHRTMPYADQVAAIVGWSTSLARADQAAFLGGTAARLWPAFEAHP